MRSKSLLLFSSLLSKFKILLSSSILLSLKLLGLNLFSLLLEDGFNKDSSVLELVTLGTEVQLVVDVSVDLLAVSVLLEQSTENTSSADGEDLARHTGLTSTLSVTSALMATLALLSLVSLNTGARVHGDLASNDKTILEEFSDVLT